MADAGAEELNCGSGNNFNGSTGLRIGGVFIILAVRQIGDNPRQLQDFEN